MRENDDSLLAPQARETERPGEREEREENQREEREEREERETLREEREISRTNEHTDKGGGKFTQK